MMRQTLLLLLAAAAPLAAAATSRAQGQRPQIMPTRDVDITYEVTRPDQPKAISHRRWLAAEHLQRVDGSDGSFTIFDRDKGEFTLVDPKSRTYRKFEGRPRIPLAPGHGSSLKQGAEAVVAGLKCVDWTWKVASEIHTACLTADGVLLRLVVQGKVVLLARSVKYGRQAPSLFQVPTGSEPALAPEGGPAE